MENIKRHSNSPPKRGKGRSRSNSKSPEGHTANDISKDTGFRKTGLDSLTNLQRK